MTSASLYCNHPSLSESELSRYKDNPIASMLGPRRSLQLDRGLHPAAVSSALPKADIIGGKFITEDLPKL